MISNIRLESNPGRSDWRQKVEEAGLTWHEADGAPYWTEDKHVALTLEAAETLEDAASELHALSLEACEQIVTRGWWERLAIPDAVVPLIEQSWQAGDFSLYGRFDLAWDGRGTPKLLEYNADTPTSLLEASVIQWQWLEANFPQSDQLNSIHEALVERWKLLNDPMIHFACDWEMLEDRQTIAYLAETAEQAGKTVELMDMPEIGYSEVLRRFTDLQERPIDRLFKLYPWEWMVEEEFFQYVAVDRWRFLEPIWKMMLSNKGLLAVLWELNPHHPLLLPAFTSREPLLNQGIQRWVEKPFFGREGAGVSIMGYGGQIAAGKTGHLGEPLIYQSHTDLFQADQTHFVWGLWMIGDECRGLSARGDHSPVTGNFSRFYPHRIEG